MKPIYKVFFIFLITGWAASTVAVTRTWDDESGDHLWANATNWTGDITPSSADTVVFSETKVGPVTVNSAVTVNSIYWTNVFGGQYDVSITPGNVLYSSNKTYVCYQAYNSNVRISGGGTFQVGGGVGSEFNVGYRTTTANMDGRMVVSNAVFNMTKLGNFGTGIQTDNGNSNGYGEVDLRDATIVTDNLVTNNFRISNNLKIGITRTSGLLCLPPAVTNIEAATIYLGPNAQSGTNFSTIDLGESPQLQTLTASNSMWVYRGRIVWSESGISKTGMPPNVSVKVGTPGNPGTLAMGHTGGSMAEARWSGFTGLETYITNLFLGRAVSGPGLCTGELDLQSPNTTKLIGSLSSNKMDIQTVFIGASENTTTEGDVQGILKLPRTVTEISVSDMTLGGRGNVSTASELNLGSNSLLNVFSVSNLFLIGSGKILHTDISGISRTGFPGSVYLKVGVSPSQRGKLIIKRTVASVQVFGRQNGTVLKGIGRLQAYLNELVVADATANSIANSQYGELDLRDCTNMLMDVDGSVSIGATIGTSVTVQPVCHGFMYLPPGTVTISSNLNIGTYRTNAIYGEGILSLSNTIVVVSNAIAINHTGIVTNEICGMPSGFDIGSTNFSIASSNATISGRMVLNFNTDPVSITQPYWGLKIRGNVTTYLQSLTNAPARLIINKSGLSAKNQSRLGIYYDIQKDTTFVGFDCVRAGTLVLLY